LDYLLCALSTCFPPSLQRLVTRLSERRMKLVLSDSAVEHLARVGFDPVFGARPVKRALQRELQTLLAKVRDLTVS
jgi:ATP-dependent Clp protease ATP-binding subunit ClpB